MRAAVQGLLTVGLAKIYEPDSTTPARPGHGPTVGPRHRRSNCRRVTGRKISWRRPFPFLRLA
jgi:hypothetical protein